MMQQQYKISSNKILRKGSGFWLLPFFVFVFSCVNQDLSKSGKLTFHNSGGFIFTVSDNFVKDHKDSPQDKYNPKVTESEADLLGKLLDRSKYCDNDKSPSYIITSKQEKVYDMTFAHLIEENYNARPIVPRTYFGQCRAK